MTKLRMSVRMAGVWFICVAVLAGCGGGGSGGSTPVGRTTGISTHLKLSGALTFDGDVQSHCTFATDGSLFSLENQQPVRINLFIQGHKTGTFAIPDVYDLQTGQITPPPGEPRIILSNISDPRVSDATFYAHSGTLVLENGGERGHATFLAYPLTIGVSNVDGQLTWTGCDGF